MNAAALTGIRIVSGTTEELIQSISNSIQQERTHHHVESALYRSVNNVHEILVLSLWDSLGSVPEEEEAYQPKPPVGKELTIKTEVISHQVYQMVRVI